MSLHIGRIVAEETGSGFRGNGVEGPLPSFSCEELMSSTIALVWYMVVAGPQGGMVVLPSTFDTREQCASAITEYQKNTPPAGWTVQCIPSASPYADDMDEEEASPDQPAQQ